MSWTGSRLVAGLLVLAAGCLTAGCSTDADDEPTGGMVFVCIGSGLDVGDPVEIEAVQDGEVVAGGSVSRTADDPPGTVGVEVPAGPVVLRFAGGEAIGEADVSDGGSVTFSVGHGCDPVR